MCLSVCVCVCVCVFVLWWCAHMQSQTSVLLHFYASAWEGRTAHEHLTGPCLHLPGEYLPPGTWLQCPVWTLCNLLNPHYASSQRGKVLFLARVFMADGQDTVMLWMLMPHHFSAVNPCSPDQRCGTTETAWLHADKADLWTQCRTCRLVFILDPVTSASATLM